AQPVVAPHDVHGPARAVHGDRGERVDAPVRVLEGATAVVVQVVADLDDVIHLHGTGKAAAAVHRLRHHRLAVEARAVAVLEHYVQFSVRAHRRPNSAPGGVLKDAGSPVASGEVRPSGRAAAERGLQSLNKRTTATLAYGSTHV